jgi:hypothetical protein
MLTTSGATKMGWIPRTKIGDATCGNGHEMKDVLLYYDGPQWGWITDDECKQCAEEGAEPTKMLTLETRITTITPEHEKLYRSEDDWRVVLNDCGGLNFYRPNWYKRKMPWTAEELKRAGELLIEVAEREGKSCQE